MSDSIRLDKGRESSAIVQRGLDAIARGNIWSGIANLSTVAYAEGVSIQELDDCVKHIDPDKQIEYLQIARTELQRAHQILGTGGYYTDDEYLLVLTLIGPTVSAVRSIRWLSCGDVELLISTVVGELQLSKATCDRNRNSFQSALRMLRRNNHPLLRVIQKIGLTE